MEGVWFVDGRVFLGSVVRVLPTSQCPPGLAGGIYDRPQLTVEEIRPIVEDAHKVTTTVACHAIGNESIMVALRAGVDTIKHATVLDEGIVEMAATQGTTLVPTMYILHTMGYRGKEFDYPVEHSESAKRFYDELVSGVEMVRKTGVKIAAGSDCINNNTIPMECSRLLDMGFTNMKVIIAATRIGAEVLLRDDELATVEVGKRADLVMLNRDPLEDIKALEEVE